jgi:hypothetical protein
MKAKYKKLFLWSSLGSLAVGTAVALAHRSRRTADQPLSCRKLPRACHGIHLWTERFEVELWGARRFVHDRYYLQPTPFKVWSVLDLSYQPVPGRAGPEGAAIYHVTHIRALEQGEDEPAQAEEYLQDRFYGIVTVVDENGRCCGPNAIARGGILEIKKCYVGGTSNGVESGEVHRSIGRILNYRIEIAPV